MHEATRKLLGVLLREMDGFDSSKKSIIIGAPLLLPRPTQLLRLLVDASSELRHEAWETIQILPLLLVPVSSFGPTPGPISVSMPRMSFPPCGGNQCGRSSSECC